jgi:hypothetical protein
MTHKICKNCGETDETNFYAQRKTLCRKCTSQHTLNYLANDPIAKARNQSNVVRWQNANILRQRFLGCRNRASKRGLEFNITLDYLETLLIEQQGKCFYTGLDMLLHIDKGEHSVSIDRYDSSQGYIRGNVVLCVTWANLMKNNHSYENFINFARIIVDNARV